WPCICAAFRHRSASGDWDRRTLTFHSLSGEYRPVLASIITTRPHLYRALWAQRRGWQLALSHWRAGRDSATGPGSRLPVRLRSATRSVCPSEWHHRAYPTGEDIAIFLWYRVFAHRPAAGLGGSLYRQDRLAG